MKNIYKQGWWTVVLVFALSNTTKAQNFIPDNYEGIWAGTIADEDNKILDVIIDFEEASPGELAGSIKINGSCEGNLYFVKTFKNDRNILVSEFSIDIPETNTACPAGGSIEFSSHFRKPIFYLKWVTPTFSASSEVRKQ